MPLTYTGGTFDTLHVGHLDLLRRCRQLGNVVVSLNTDEFVEKYKGVRPIYSYEERKEMLENCKLVDLVIPNTGGEDSKPAILSVHPDYIVIGSDWLKKDYCKQMGFTPEWLEEQNISLVYIPRVRRVSSTEIKERVRK